MPVCTTCHVEKPLELFVRDRARPSGHRRKCKLCQAAYYREWMARDLERATRIRAAASKRYRAENPLRRRLFKYGLDLDSFAALRLAQADRCAICHREDRDRGLVVDHDHATTEVRGLLCHDCNRAIGMLHDDVTILERALDYLRRGGTPWVASRRSRRRPTGG